MALSRQILVGAVGTGSVVYIFGLTPWAALGVLTVWFLTFGGVNYLKAALKTGPRDAR